MPPPDTKGIVISKGFSVFFLFFLHVICSNAGLTLEKTPYNSVYFAKCSQLRN